MIKHAIKFLAPLCGLLLLSTGSSFLGTLLILELRTEGSSPLLVGSLTSMFYGGYIIGAFKLERFITRIGHIRAYSVFASLIAVISILHGLVFEPYTWLGLRFIYGFCNAGLFIVVESWLLNLSTVDLRGRILALYMVTFYLAQAMGQAALRVIEIETFLPYAIVTMLASLSVVPLCSTRSSSPQFSDVEVLKLKDLFKLSTTGTLGALAGGLALGVIYGILPMTVKDFGFSSKDIGNAMAIIILGGAMLQYPIGKFSDLMDRRLVLITVAILTFVTTAGMLVTIGNNMMLFYICAFFFGGFAFVLYPLSTNLVCDLVEPERLLGAVSGLLIFYSIGATAGPFIAPLVIQVLGPNGVFYYLFAICVLLFLISTWRTTVRTPVSADEQGDFVSAPRTTPVAAELSPRNDEDELED